MTLASYVYTLILIYTLTPAFHFGHRCFTIWIFVATVVFCILIECTIMAVCINCHIILRPNLQRYHYYAVDLSSELVTIVEEWCGREVSTPDRLCQECLTLVLQEAENRMLCPDHRQNIQVGHVYVCICCGISLDRRTGRRRHSLSGVTDERNYIENQIFPRQVPHNAWACRGCWLRAHRNRELRPQNELVSGFLGPQVNLLDNQNEPPAPEVIEVAPAPFEPQMIVDDAPEPPSSITVPSSEGDSWAGIHVNVPEPAQALNLTNYRRTSDTTNRCFVPDCESEERARIPKYLKRALLKEHKLFITSNARVCQNHAGVYNWDFLQEHEFISEFNSAQIEAMLNLLSTESTNSVLNFEDIENATDAKCRYWTGLTISNFLALYNSVPQLHDMFRNPKTALGIYLAKLRTGESMARIASIFLVGKGTVSLYIKKVRNCLTEYYVPRHLGINHITREALSARNLLIPQGLFGTEDNNPIVICDGTYVYVQKSSNYSYQKKTWSLHKHQNLVKPFLIVTCDGHIIDVFGPYAAIVSDADIMRNLFQNADAELRSYFRENDVFILDRGFRDVIGLLTSLGYSVHKPESLEPGETQLSTINANKSRCVTLCRWVVEVVNGRFKRDFKLFRSKYFNTYSRNLKPDFRIAAAILNNFHPVVTDHPDAHAILNRALSRLERPNLLADSVVRERINRDRSNFININAQLPELHVFPVMEMQDLVMFALGTYQIKQARSYYGEHIRQNGSFNVEIDTNLSRFENNKLLLRGRIRSRHVANKQYLTYILLNLNGEDWCQKIEEYYCTCIIGKRTVGSCAHVMTIIWYLGWARHQDTILPPARFLDDIFEQDE